MNTDSTRPAPPAPATRTARWPVMLAVLALVIAGTVLATLWVARTWLYPQPFQPVVLDAREQAVLAAKLDAVAEAPQRPADRSADTSVASDPDTAEADTAALRPERYTERPEDRVIHFTQRELNAMIARNPDLAERLVLHMADGVLSATMLITLPPDLPVFAGQTVRVATGLRLHHAQGHPVIAIEGVSVMGVPLPAAWLGGLKGQDLVSMQHDGGGFWSAFGEGVRDLRIEQGRLRVELAE